MGAASRQDTIGTDMIKEEEQAIRVQGQSQALIAATQSFIDQYVILSGELAVAKAKLAEFEKQPQKEDIINP